MNMSTLWVSGRLLTALVVGAVSLSIQPAIATAATSTTGPSLAGNVTEIASPSIFYASAPRLSARATPAMPTSPRYYIVQGTVDSSGSYQYPVTLQTPGNTPAVARELAIDEATHRELVVAGYTTAAQVQAVMGRTPANLSGGSKIGPGTLSGGVQPMFPSPGYSWHYMYTRWYDPAFITLSSAYDEADVWWNSSAVMTNWNWYYQLTWNTNNGWSLAYHNSFPQILPNNQGLATLSYASMKTSSWFPSPTCGTTTTYYWPNQVYTYIGGSMWWHVNTWADSGCLFFLNWEFYEG